MLNTKGKLLSDSLSVSVNYPEGSVPTERRRKLNTVSDVAKGLLTRYDCDCNFFIATNKLCGI